MNRLSGRVVEVRPCGSRFRSIRSRHREIVSEKSFNGVFDAFEPTEFSRPPNTYTVYRYTEYGLISHRFSLCGRPTNAAEGAAQHRSVILGFVDQSNRVGDASCRSSTSATLVVRAACVSSSAETVGTGVEWLDRETTGREAPRLHGTNGPSSTRPSTSRCVDAVQVTLPPDSERLWPRSRHSPTVVGPVAVRWPRGWRLSRHGAPPVGSELLAIRLSSRQRGDGSPVSGGLTGP